MRIITTTIAIRSEIGSNQNRIMDLAVGITAWISKFCY